MGTEQQRAAADDLAECKAILKYLEWGNSQRPICPLCLNNKQTGHKTGCRLGALVKDYTLPAQCQAQVVISYGFPSTRTRSICVCVKDGGHRGLHLWSQDGEEAISWRSEDLS